jgi:hypothetical protein
MASFPVNGPRVCWPSEGRIHTKAMTGSFTGAEKEIWLPSSSRITKKSIAKHTYHSLSAYLNK